MFHINIEIKAKCTNHAAIRKILKSRGADFKGIDHQVDTYFKVSNGRLKLREGNIENSLIFYQRENVEGPKQSDVVMFETDPESPIKKILSNSIGVLATVDKKREIYFIDNVKFHIDTVKNLGMFIEIEAIDIDGSLTKENLLKQCQFYMGLFGIPEKDLVSVSYSDLLLQKGLL